MSLLVGEMHQLHLDRQPPRRPDRADVGDGGTRLPFTLRVVSLQTQLVGPDTLGVFQEVLGELWEAVEPLCVETSAEEIRQLAARLPAHLASHAANRGLAGRLAAQLERLLAPWEAYDAVQRSVARAAVAYFLESSDAVPDELVGGLVDDDVVVDAARRALAPAVADDSSA